MALLYLSYTPLFACFLAISRQQNCFFSVFLKAFDSFFLIFLIGIHLFLSRFSFQKELLTLSCKLLPQFPQNPPLCLFFSSPTSVLKNALFFQGPPFCFSLSHQKPFSIPKTLLYDVYMAALAFCFSHLALLAGFFLTRFLFSFLT